MEPLTTGILASALYDFLKHGVTVTAAALKEQLGGWLQNDTDAVSVEQAIKKLDLDDGLSEKAIRQLLEQSAVLGSLIQKINAKIVQNAPSAITTVNQTHSGSGDNVAGNKLVN